MRATSSKPAADATPASDVGSVSAAVTTLILIWPGLVLLLLYAALVAIAIAIWLWTVVLAPVDLDWLKPVVARVVDKTWWRAASTQVAAQSSWVMPSALATVGALCAAIFAPARADRVTYERLAALTAVVASAASLWAWFSLPSIGLARNPVPALGACFVAVLAAALAGQASTFIRSPDARREVLQDRRSALLRAMEWFHGAGTVVHRPHPVLRIAMNGVVPPVVVTACDAVIFIADNQGGMLTFAGFNTIIGVVAWSTGVVVVWPFRPRRAVRPLVIAGQVIFLAIGAAVPILWGVRVATDFHDDGWALVLAAVYLVWGISILVSTNPLLLRLRRHAGEPDVGDRRPRSGPLDWTLAAAVREWRLLVLRDLIATVEKSLSRLDPPSSRPVRWSPPWRRARPESAVVGRARRSRAEPRL